MRAGVVCLLGLVVLAVLVAVDLAVGDFPMPVSDVERSVAWWQGLLGLEPVRLEEWRRGEVPFVSVRISPSTIRYMWSTSIRGLA